MSAGLRTLETAYFWSFGRVERFDARKFLNSVRLRGTREASGLEGRMGRAEEAVGCIF